MRRRSFRRIRLRLAFRGILLLALSVFLTSMVEARQNSVMNMPASDNRAAKTPEVTGKLLQGMGNWHHPITTKSAEAQKFFDQGLTLVYAFNFDEAKRSFQRASQLDPTAAMPYWGLALALGPSYNGGTFVLPVNEKQATKLCSRRRNWRLSARKMSALILMRSRNYFPAMKMRIPRSLRTITFPQRANYEINIRTIPTRPRLYGAILMDLHTQEIVDE